VRRECRRLIWWRREGVGEEGDEERLSQCGLMFFFCFLFV